jgi:enoyl-CoA hydratase/carnithine racemase
LSTAPTPEPVLLDIRGPKATLTLNRPRTGNDLDQTLLTLLTKHLKALEKKKDVRAVVLTGNGRFFCTGMNLGSSGEGLKGNNEEQFERGALLVLLYIVS